jgi:hypothetical protein
VNGPILTAPFAAPELYPSATGTFSAPITTEPEPWLGPGGYATGGGYTTGGDYGGGGWDAGGAGGGGGGGGGGFPPPPPPPPPGPGGFPLPFPLPGGPPGWPLPPFKRIAGGAPRMAYSATCIVPSALVCGSWRGRKRLLGFDRSGNPYYAPPAPGPTGAAPPTAGRGRYGSGLPGAAGPAGAPGGGGGGGMPGAPGAAADAVLEGFAVPPAPVKKKTGAGWLLAALAVLGLNA